MQDDLNGDTGNPKKASVRIDTITPEMAVKWLEKNSANRNVQDAVVSRYARDMKMGNWLLTGEAIQFGETGRLLNGQHRLMACIRADTAFQSVVVRNLAAEQAVVDAIDTGTKRTLGHALQIHGESDANNLAAIINFCWRYERHRLGSSEWATHAEAFEWLAENPGVRAATAVSQMVHRNLKAQRGPVGTAFYLNAKVDAEASQAFWERASTGEGLDADDAILAYRRWVIGVLGRRDKPESKVQLAYALRAMSQWREGRRVRILIHRPNEEMPELWS